MALTQSQIEHLKEYVTHVFTAYHDGYGSSTKDMMTSDMALRLIHHELDRVNNDDSRIYGKVAQLRVTIAPGCETNFRQVLKTATVLSLRLIGARQKGDSSVAYLKVRAVKARVAQQLVAAFESAGLRVRDWSFGA